MARMTDILRADELKLAKTAYETWLKLDRAAKKAAYATATGVGGGKRANRGSRIVFIQPFGAPDNFWYETKGLAPAADAPAPTTVEESASGLITAVISATTAFTPLVVPAGANNMSNRARKVQFAKVRCTERAAGAGTPTTSRITGLPYTKYNTNTISSPFGMAPGATDKTEQFAARAIRNSLLTGNPAGRFVSFTSQGDVGNITKAPAA
ncbi:hypothetical protein [Microcoleus sp. S13_C5]|uniref:hypothetical protein n=1 Tax=Microcoleus sp. S13_C5 TaxID=3055411 RepID=UPI002FD6BD2A